MHLTQRGQFRVKNGGQFNRNIHLLTTLMNLFMQAVARTRKLLR